MGEGQEIVLLLVLSFVMLGRAYDACALYSWDDKALRSYCTTPEHPAHRSSACTITRLCASTISAAAGGVCTTQRLYITLCADKSSLPECRAFQRLFGSDAEYGACVERMSLRLGSASSMEGFMSEACSVGSRRPGCDRCNAAGCDTPDPLLAYASACRMETRAAAGCNPWSAFCSRETGPVAEVLCAPRRASSTLLTSADSSAGRVAAAAAAAGAVVVAGGQSPPPPADPCIADSTQPSCAGYTYPDSAAEGDIDRLCGSMPDMPGCAIDRACKEGHGSVAAKYCQPFVVLATLCHDMPGMKGCENYKALCSKPGSVVQQCGQQPAVPGAPTWSQARKAVFSACEDHPMGGCASCTRSDCPDPLASLADICHEMPNMAVCRGFWAFCAAAGTEDVAEWCAEDDSKYLPSMLMYFHQRTQELLLWKEWRPRTQGQYLLSLLAILAMGVAATGLKTAKGALVLRWNHDRAVSGARPPRVTSVWRPQQGQLGEILAKSAITGVSLTLDYFNMLIAMTFNVGFFCAVIAGYIAGTLLFGHVLENYGTILHQQRRDLADARVRQQEQEQREQQAFPLLVNGSGGVVVVGGGVKGGGGGAEATTSTSDTESEERLRIAVEGEGDCNCVHSA